MQGSNMRKEIQIMSSENDVMRAAKRVKRANEAIATLEREPDATHKASCFARQDMRDAKRNLKSAEWVDDVLRSRLGYSAI